MITDTNTQTRIDEVANGIFRISTPTHFATLGDFSFNQYLLLGEEALLFHTGQKELFSLVKGAIERVMDIESLRYISFSHFEADECGSLNYFLATAPRAEILCGRIMAMTSVSDFATRAPRILRNGEELELGRHTVRWIDTPHVPHSWDAGLLFESRTQTLLCADLFVQPGKAERPLISGDILAESEPYLRNVEYFASTSHTARTLNMLGELKPKTLACMHGSAWQGDGQRALAGLVEAVRLAGDPAQLSVQA
jgi:flavorubredoxin